jgi:hypothetical protein
VGSNPISRISALFGKRAVDHDTLAYYKTRRAQAEVSVVLFLSYPLDIYFYISVNGKINLMKYTLSIQIPALVTLFG